MIAPSATLQLEVPASTSNLGPGYDVLGLALDRYLSVRWEPGDHPLRVELGGTLARLDPERDLVRASLEESLGAPALGVLDVRSTVPVARGLGSSAAARIAGRLLGLAARGGAEIAGAPGPAMVDREAREALLLEVSRAEGHPDNAVPSVVGGFVAASLEDDTLRWTPLPLSPSVGMAFAAPGVEVRTDDARRALPTSVAHADAVANGARLAQLLAGLARADGDQIAWGLHDRLHTAWRWPLVPEADAARAAALEAGAWGVALSGSGSGLLAFGPVPCMDEVAEAMRAAFAPVSGSEPACGFAVRRALVGAAAIRVIPPPAPPG